MFIHLVVIGWLYVVVMMAVAEATAPTGTVLGAIVTFFLYGVGPVALVVYLLTAPARRRAVKERERAAQEEAREEARRLAAEAASGLPSALPSGLPDAGGKAPADPVAAVRKVP